MNKLIGITGKIGAGKTTLVNKLKSIYPDYIYIDVDDFRRNLFNKEEYVNELKQVIPELNNFNHIDSIILNRYIYKNETYMQSYKRIMYRYLFNYINSFKNKSIFIEWSLILKDNLDEYFDKIIYVDAPKEIRLNRINKNDLSIEELLKRDSLQDVNLSNFSNYLYINNETKIDMDMIINYINGMECKFTLPENGGKAIFEITHQCNYNCSYCMFSCNNKKIENELTTRECFHIIDELYKNGFRHLKITGGEPFIRKDIIEILEYASKYLKTDISTNASLLTKEKVDLLNKIKLKMIHVSLDGLEYEHNSVRGNNTYERTIKGLNLLSSSTNRIRIGCVIHKNNEYLLREMIENCANLNVDEIIYSIMEPPAGADKSLYKTRSNTELEEEIEKLKMEYQQDIVINYNFKIQPNYVKKCPAGETFLFIDNFGRVSPCPWIFENYKNCISTNSLRNNDLKSLLNEEEIQKFLSLKKCGRCYGKI